MILTCWFTVFHIKLSVGKRCVTFVAVQTPSMPLFLQCFCKISPTRFLTSHTYSVKTLVSTFLAVQLALDLLRCLPHRAVTRVTSPTVSMIEFSFVLLMHQHRNSTATDGTVVVTLTAVAANDPGNTRRRAGNLKVLFFGWNRLLAVFTLKTCVVVGLWVFALYPFLLFDGFEACCALWILQREKTSRYG